MAEIRVEERRGSNTTWVWILLLLLLVAAGIWYVLGRSDTADDTLPPPATTQPTGAVTPAAPASPASADSVAHPAHPPAATMVLVRA